MRDERLKNKIIDSLTRGMCYEIRVLCSDKLNSTMLSSDSNSLKSFSLREVIQDAHAAAPTLTRILSSCLKDSSNKDAVLIAILGMIAKQHRNRICLFQRVISLLFYTGNYSKKVC